MSNPERYHETRAISHHSRLARAVCCRSRCPVRAITFFFYSFVFFICFFTSGSFLAWSLNNSGLPLSCKSLPQVYVLRWDDSVDTSSPIIRKSGWIFFFSFFFFFFIFFLFKFPKCTNWIWLLFLSNYLFLSFFFVSFFFHTDTETLTGIETHRDIHRHTSNDSLTFSPSTEFK